VSRFSRERRKGFWARFCANPAWGVIAIALPQISCDDRCRTPQVASPNRRKAITASRTGTSVKLTGVHCTHRVHGTTVFRAILCKKTLCSRAFFAASPRLVFSRSFETRPQ